MLPEFVSNPEPGIYLYGSHLTMDFETTNLDKGSALNPKNRVLLVCWKRDEGRHSCTGPDFSPLFNALDEVDFFVAHHAKFELQWLRRLGYNRDMLVYDTMLGEFVRLGNRRGPLDLGSLVTRDLGLSKMDIGISEEVCPSTLDPLLLETYCANDVSITDALFNWQLGILGDLNLLPVVYTRCLLTPILAEIELNGMTLDPAKVEEWYREYAEKLRILKGKLEDFTGGVNPNSPPQMGVYLYETLGFKELTDERGEPRRTDTGRRCTDIDTITALRPSNEAQRAFVDLYKDYGSLKVNTNVLSKMWECCADSKAAGVPPILYAQFNQTIAQNHRLTSSGKKYKLQFQNFNRDFKELFTSRFPGWEVGEGDAAQLEFIVAAHLGRDPVASADIRDPGFDAHIQTLTVMLNGKYDRQQYKDLFAKWKAGDKKIKAQRADNVITKAHTFKPLYAGSSGTQKQKKYYKYFQQRYAAMYNAQDKWVTEVSQKKKLVTETGLIFYWPHCRVQPDGYISGRTQIFNYPVSMLATADIVPIGVVCAYYRMRASGLLGFLVNTVHDSIIAELPTEEGPKFREICNTALTTDVFKYLKICYNIDFTVPLGVETKVGSHWSLGEEMKIKVDSRELSDAA